MMMASWKGMRTGILINHFQKQHIFFNWRNHVPLTGIEPYKEKALNSWKKKNLPISKISMWKNVELHSFTLFLVRDSFLKVSLTVKALMEPTFERLNWRCLTVNPLRKWIFTLLCNFVLFCFVLISGLVFSTVSHKSIWYVFSTD